MNAAKQGKAAAKGGKSEEAIHLDNYFDYARTLRAWLVAYGIGAPVIFMTNDKVTEKIGKSESASTIVTLFLLGVALQVVLALINKWGAWHLYAGENKPAFKKTWRYRIWGRITDMSWLDFWVDIVALSVFVVATWKTLVVFLGPASG